MTIKDIRDKYNVPSKRPQEVVNFAIRKEMPGGDETLQAIEELRKLIHYSKKGYLASSHELEQVVQTLNAGRDEMARAICKDYGVEFRGDRHG